MAPETSPNDMQLPMLLVGMKCYPEIKTSNWNWGQRAHDRNNSQIPRYQTLATEKPCPAHGQITSLAAKTTDLAAPRTNVQHPKRATAKKRLGEPLWELL